MSTSVNLSKKSRSLTNGQMFILGVVLVKLISHLIANTQYGFHRDELLYFSLGHHPDWGYWSVPPLTGWISAALQATLGSSVFVFRLLATLVSCATVYLAGTIAGLFGGKAWAQGLAALGVALSPMIMRSGMLYQPVPFDIFFWTLAFYWLVRYINEERSWQLYALSGTLAFAFLNKYLIIFFLIAFLVGSIFTPQRKLFKKKTIWLAALLALVIILPNILWQIKYNFPVLTHMRLLRANQLVNVSPVDFLIEQFLIILSGSLFWVVGLWFVLVKKPAFRLLGFIYIMVIALLLIFQGKSYYSAGLYPVLIAAGAVAWESWFAQKVVRVGLPVVMILLTWPLVPFGITILKPEKMVSYGAWASETLGLSGFLRWEDDSLHELPQDYADMFGWEEIGRLALQAWEKAPDDLRPMVYCENYGQAGAILWYATPKGVPVPVSFSDMFAIWAPEETESQGLIYVNDELGEDIQEAFAKITLIGTVDNPYARENGAQVYLCEEPVYPFGELWSERIREVKAELGIAK